MRHATFVSTGCYVPEIEISNDVYRERLEDSDPEFVDKVEKKSGIGRRFYAPEDWATSDLAVRAAKQAIARAGITAEDVDMIVLGTDSPDYITPSTSVVVQHKLGAKNAGTFDVGCACASFPTATSTAAGLIAANPHLKNVLVIGAYMMHKLADPMDPISFLYGDGAGAAIMQPSDEPGFISSTFRADGVLAQDWAILMGGTAEPANKEAIDAGRHQVRLYKNFPPEVNDGGWPILARDVAANGGFTLDEVDHFIFTQVRKRTIDKVMGFIEQPIEKAHMIMGKWGYTGSACIPMALHDALDEGKLKAGDLVAMIGSGVGFNQAAAAFRVSEQLAASANKN